MSVQTVKKDYVDELYDSFQCKDMTRREFRSRYVRAMDPRGVNRDLHGLVDEIHKHKQARRSISGHSLRQR